MADDLEFRRNRFSIRQNMRSKDFVDATFRNLMSEMRRRSETFGSIVCGASRQSSVIAAIDERNETVKGQRRLTALRVAGGSHA
ncbi:hypothetical protein [Tardiphaga sp.]|uniref:hypothetical protein n=1 Tax=Tardiphaga sp. TaxID=1926292 RepID=UPI00261301A0|nr:hypothetical protein [Tardiphaga sp.]